MDVHRFSRTNKTSEYNRNQLLKLAFVYSFTTRQRLLFLAITPIVLSFCFHTFRFLYTLQRNEPPHFAQEIRNMEQELEADRTFKFPDINEEPIARISLEKALEDANTQEITVQYSLMERISWELTPFMLVVGMFACTIAILYFIAITLRRRDPELNAMIEYILSAKAELKKIRA